MGRAATPESIEAIAPFRYAAPLAPDMAARREAKLLHLAEVVDFCRARIDEANAPLFIEGVGGMMSPIAEDGTCLDLIHALNAHVLLVAGSYLGAISHALTAAAALNARGGTLACVVVNESAAYNIGVEETRAAVARFLVDVDVIAMARGGGDDAIAAIANKLRLR